MTVVVVPAYLLSTQSIVPVPPGSLKPLIGLTLVTFLSRLLLFAGVNPFERLGFVPPDGAGLNPQLQNYWMTIHPPVLYLGFTAFAIPFAFAMASLLNGRTDSRWIA